MPRVLSSTSIHTPHGPKHAAFPAGVTIWCHLPHKRHLAAHPCLVVRVQPAAANTAGCDKPAQKGLRL